MSAASFLSYGGVLKVIRATDDDLNNANAGVGMASTDALQVLNYDDYQNNHTEAQDFTYAAKNPGSWGNELKVCQIDDFGDQISVSEPPTFLQLVHRLVWSHRSFSCCYHSWKRFDHSIYWILKRYHHWCYHGCNERKQRNCC